MAASWATAPAGVFGKPVGTPAGPVPVAAGTSSVGAGWAEGMPRRALSGSTVSMGAAAMLSRYA